MRKKFLLACFVFSLTLSLFYTNSVAISISHKDWFCLMLLSSSKYFNSTSLLWIDKRCKSAFHTGWVQRRSLLVHFFVFYVFPIFSLSLFNSFLWLSVVRVWADQVGGGVEDPLCLKVGYSEPIRFGRSREPRRGLHTSGERLGFFGTVILNFDWLTKFKSLSCSILIGCRQEFGFALNLVFLMY